MGSAPRESFPTRTSPDVRYTAEKPEGDAVIWATIAAMMNQTMAMTTSAATIHKTRLRFGSYTNTIGSPSSTATFLNGELAFTSSTVSQASTTCFRVVDKTGVYDWIYWSSQAEVVTTTQPAFCSK